MFHAKKRVSFLFSFLYTLTVCCSLLPRPCLSFFVAPLLRRPTWTRPYCPHVSPLPILRHITSSIASSYPEQEHRSAEDEDTPSEPIAPPQPPSSLERAWRSVPKPLLSIGAKGASLSHGNSLKQLLEAHSIVKVKVNTKQFDKSLRVASDALKKLVVEAGMEQEPELLHVRESDKLILMGLPGMREKIEAGEFPVARAEPSSTRSKTVSNGRKENGNGESKKRALAR